MVNAKSLKKALLKILFNKFLTLFPMTVNLLGYNISLINPSIFNKEKIIVNTINPHSYCVAKKDKDFKTALMNSDFLMPDGIGIVMAANFIENVKIRKIAGYDIFISLMHELERTGGSCFFLGASTQTLKKIKDRASKEFPNVTINAFSPPYKAEFTEEESLNMCTTVNKYKPTVLFVGMTAPKQEKWIHQNYDRIDTKILCSIGAVFDFYAGTTKRAPNWMINLGLEWFHRSIKNPSRLGKRNLKSNPEFVLDVLKTKYYKN